VLVMDQLEVTSEFLCLPHYPNRNRFISQVGLDFLISPVSTIHPMVLFAHRAIEKSVHLGGAGLEPFHPRWARYRNPAQFLGGRHLQVCPSDFDLLHIGNRFPWRQGWPM